MQDKLTREESGAQGALGVLVDINGDYLILSAVRERRFSLSTLGSAHIFRRDRSNWVHEAILTEGVIGNDYFDFAWFGSAVSMDDGYALVSNFPPDTRCFQNTGFSAVYIHTNFVTETKTVFLPVIVK